MGFLKKDKKEKNDYNALFHAYSVGMAIVAGILVGGVMGYFLDVWLGTSPWLLFAFLIFGLIAGIKNALHFMKKAGIELDGLRKDDSKGGIDKDTDKGD